MKWRVEFERKKTALRPGEVGRLFAVEVSAATSQEARALAMDQARRERKDRCFDITAVRKK